MQAEADTNAQSPSETRPAPFQNIEGEKENSDSSPSSETSTSDDTSADEGVRGSLSKTERKKRRTVQIERQVRAVALLDGFEADGSSTPQTPRQGRAKRRREWKWTLGPVDPVDKASNSGSENVSLLHAAQVNSGSQSLRVSTDFAPGH